MINSQTGFLKAKLFLTLLLGLQTVFCQQTLAQYRDARDEEISKALVDQFRRECSHKVGIDQDSILELRQMYDKSQREKSEVALKAFKCYQDRMPQLAGLHQLYSELCREVSRDGAVWNAAETFRLLVMSQKYKKGIAPFHDLLNDCLIEKEADAFIVKVSRQRVESATLRTELEKIKVKRPFEESRVEFR